MSPNLPLLQQRSAEIRRNLKLLRQAGGRDCDAFTTDPDLVDASLYRLLTTVEAAQAICIHLASRIPTRAPESGPDCFRALSEAGVIEEELAQRLCSMARFRNLLVHRYWELDLERTHRILREDLGDLELYLTQVGEYLRGDL